MNTELGRAENRIAELEKELEKTRDELERVTDSKMFQEVMLWFILAIMFAWVMQMDRYWVVGIVLTQIVVAIVWNAVLFLRALKKWRAISAGS